MPEPWITILFAAILLGILVLFAVEKVEKTIVAMLGAGLCLFLSYAFHLIEEAHGEVPFYIGAVNWHTVGIIIGASVFVEVVSHSGVFTWTAVRLMKASRGDPFRLLIYFGVLTVMFSAVLDNITAMILVGSLTVVAARSLKLNLVTFLVVEGILTNIGGILTLISSIPNIIVGTEAGFTYGYYFVVAGPYVALTTALTLFVARRIFRDSLRPATTEEERVERLRRVESFDEWETVHDRRFFYVSWGAMFVVIVGFAAQSYVPVVKHMGLESVALGAATLMLLLYPGDVEERLSKVEWSLIFFFTGLFVIIGCMEEAQVLQTVGRAIARLLQWNNTVGGVVLLWITTACSAVTANIPLAAMLAKIVSSGGFAADNVALWWTVIFGANLGGNITPIGSASTLIATNLLRKEGADAGFLGFVRLAVVFAGAQLVVASTYVTLYMRFGNAFTLWGNAALYLVLAVVAVRAVAMRHRRRE